VGCLCGGLISRSERGGKIAQRRTIIIAMPGNFADPTRSGVGSAQEGANGDNIAAPFLGSGGNIKHRFTPQLAGPAYVAPARPRGRHKRWPQRYVACRRESKSRMRIGSEGADED
jgi:hypothetical protein